MPWAEEPMPFSVPLYCLAAPEEVDLGVLPPSLAAHPERTRAAAAMTAAGAPMRENFTWGIPFGGSGDCWDEPVRLGRDGIDRS